MIELTAERGTPEWRAAHRCKISASDAGAFMAAAGTKARQALIDRLLLDFQGIDDHRDDHPDPWMEQHEVELKAAVEAYGKSRRVPVRTPGLIGSDTLSWLVCSPHGLTESAVIMTRTRRTMQAWAEGRWRFSRAERVKAQLTAWICGLPFVRVVDVCFYGTRVRLHVHEEHTSFEWLSATALVKLVSVWNDLQRLQRRA